MTEKEQKEAAKKFAEQWKNQGYEKGQSQPFWIQLLSDVLGVKNPTTFIEFEDQVHIDKSTGFIDGYIPSTKILIEQKSIKRSLREAIKQSDGSLLTPFQQAKKYIVELPVDKHPKWVITCNFKSFLIYNMNNPNGEPEEILLENLEKEVYRLQFIVDSGNENLKREMQVSIKAGELVGKIYDEILPLYKNSKSEDSLKSLNMLCVRIVFCLYAEDAGLFGKRNMFHDYLKKFESKDLRRALIDLFRVLDQKADDRDPYIEDELAQFPYVNGGLFADENIEIPNLTDNVRELLLAKASEDFDWSEISPTIFGAVFESTLNPETRRSGGMHYTSIENIHKVIDPLFLEDLKNELKEIKEIKVLKTRNQKLTDFQNKISKLKFLDPACGSGNFLTESYLSLRRIENDIIETINQGQIGILATYNPIKVSIQQFYGIEINDFAVTVAKTALWIAESQMMHETEEILHMNLEFLPLKSYTNITEGNALRVNWNDVLPNTQCSYIMGNPPFSGTRTMESTQKEDVKLVFGNKWNSANSLDYVACWYKIAAEIIKNTKIKCAFVSTNSITQGEQVTALWKPLFEEYNIHFDFAYQTFVWDSEASIKAKVHCVIIGFSSFDEKKVRKLFIENKEYRIDNINAYLKNAPNIFIERQTKPLCNVPEMYLGCSFNDNGNLVMTKEEKDILIKEEPQAEQFIKPYVMGKDFIERNPRYCLWLKDANPSEIRKCPRVMEKIEKVRLFREECKNKETKESANTPTIPSIMRYYNNNFNSDYIAIPKVSSQRRKYIPIELLKANVIAGDKIFLMPKGDIYSFGILTSNVHMAWMRAICGRLKSDYSYSSTIVYNTLVWPNSSKEQRLKIEKTAQAILDARAKYPESSLADLYDELTMPAELRKAHQENDKAVMEAYGFDWRKMTESDCVSKLMELYRKALNI